MKLHVIDLLIILAYLVTILGIGLIMKKRAQSSKGEYLLGGNKLPWYMLGLSNASGMFDISGTSWLVMITFVYGLKSIWIPWLWPVFNQIFLMVYLSLWLRRSNVTTGAEWISTRFGSGHGARLSHTVVVIYALIGCLGFLAYGFVGLGKFVMIFVPWEYISPFIPFEVAPQYVPHVYGIVFTIIATTYAILGGMVSIVWADVVQYAIMTVSSIVIGIIAIKALMVNSLVVPEGWKNPFFGWELDLDWSGIVDQVNVVIANDGYSLFSIFMMMVLFKGILVSAAGPAPNYDMQKILATKSPKEAAKMSGSVSFILMPARYFMIGGFAVLGLVYFDKLNLKVGNVIDFEQILPSAISEFVPVGFMGLLLAGLMAAFMSTFAGTLNAAQAYIVNDLYLKYINKKASSKKVSYANYLVGIGVVVISILLGMAVQNIDSVLKWIVSALWGSYIASNVLKWYWWRFNGTGYFWGMIVSLFAAMAMPLFISDAQMLYYFPVLLVISIVGCIVGTYSTGPTDMNTLKEFYYKVRPWGFWKPIHKEVKLDYPDFRANKNFGKDMFNIVIGIIWQTSLVALPLYIVILEHKAWIISLSIAFVTSLILKKTWWDKLEN